MIIRFKKLSENAIIPHAATADSAGLDLHACIGSPLAINPEEAVSVPCGVACCPERRDVVMSSALWRSRPVPAAALPHPGRR